MEGNKIASTGRDNAPDAKLSTGPAKGSYAQANSEGSGGSDGRAQAARELYMDWRSTTGALVDHYIHALLHAHWHCYILRASHRSRSLRVKHPSRCLKISPLPFRCPLLRLNHSSTLNPRMIYSIGASFSIPITLITLSDTNSPQRISNT
jgi:hypothetical protein